MSGSFQGEVERSYAAPPEYGEAEDLSLRGNIGTLGDLLRINYKVVSSREQMRRNIAERLRSNRPVLPGIVGYDDDVLPAMCRAVLAGHDMLLIGQMGQAKTMLARKVAAELLSPMPIIEHSITNDCPMDLPAAELISLLDGGPPEGSSPNFYVSPESAERIRDNGLDTRISWADGLSRYRYVLATPDISVKDLVGYIDAVKVARRGTEMYRIESYSPGQLMQARHGIICVDELPVLDPRKQVALLSVLQEGIFTTGAYPVVFRPQTVLVATANPVDYTHSGKVIEPLYDRLESHIHTHYPATIQDEMLIVLQESQIPDGTVVPGIVLRALARLVQMMRASPRINQERGVSVRIGIAGLEVLAGEALMVRSLAARSGHAPLAVPRLVDMDCLMQAAKFELAEIDDSVSSRRAVLSELIMESVKEVCLEVVSDIGADDLEALRGEFGDRTFPVSQAMEWNGEVSYSSQLAGFGLLRDLVEARALAALDSQLSMIGEARARGVRFDPLALTEGPEDIGFAAAGEMAEAARDGIRSTMLEAVLEGLRWSKPRVLERRDAGYARA